MLFRSNYTSSSWNTKEAESTVFDLKAVLLDVFRRIGIPVRNLTYAQDSDEIFAARLVVSDPTGKYLAEIGILRSSLLRKFDIDQDVAYCEADWKALFKIASRSKTTFSELPKTLPVRRDFALLIDKSVSFARVESVIRKAERKLLGEIGRAHV